METGSHVSKDQLHLQVVHKFCNKHTREDSLDTGNKHKNLGEAGEVGWGERDHANNKQESLHTSQPFLPTG